MIKYLSHTNPQTEATAFDVARAQAVYARPRVNDTSHRGIDMNALAEDVVRLAAARYSPEEADEPVVRKRRAFIRDILAAPYSTKALQVLEELPDNAMSMYSEL